MSERVNGHHLRMRLVYERVPHHRVTLRAAQDSGGMVLADTLEIAAGPFEEYLRSPLNTGPAIRAPAACRGFATLDDRHKVVATHVRSLHKGTETLVLEPPR